MWRRRTHVLAVPADTDQVVVMQAQIARAGRIIDGYLEAQSRFHAEDRDEELIDALLEVKSALGLSKPRPAVPVIPGRSS